MTETSILQVVSQITDIVKLGKYHMIAKDDNPSSSSNSNNDNNSNTTTTSSYHITKKSSIVLSSVQLQHPAAALISKVLINHQKAVGDGTSFLLLFIGGLVSEASKILLQQPPSQSLNHFNNDNNKEHNDDDDDDDGYGIHDIVVGYTDILPVLISKIDGRKLSLEGRFFDLAYSAIVTKVIDPNQDAKLLASLCVKACVNKEALREIRPTSIILQHSALASEVIDGLVLNILPVSIFHSMELMNVRVIVVSKEVPIQYLSSSLSAMIANIKPVTANLIIATDHWLPGEVTDDIIYQDSITTPNILIYHRLDGETMSSMAKQSGATVIISKEEISALSSLILIESESESMMKKCGIFILVRVMPNGVKQCHFISSPSPTSTTSTTMILRGLTVDELNRNYMAVLDGLAVIRHAFNDNFQVLEGGGKTELSLINDLSLLSQSNGNSIIINNAVSNALMMVVNRCKSMPLPISEYNNSRSDDDDDDDNDDLIDHRRNIELLDSYFVKKSSISTAITTACTLLRIDKVLHASFQTSQQQQQQDEQDQQQKQKQEKKQQLPPSQRHRRQFQLEKEQVLSSSSLLK